MLEMGESDMPGARVAERRPSESEAADFSSVSLLRNSFFLPRGRTDELVWLEQNCRPSLQTDAALFPVYNLWHIDVALCS
jgi:hypothetical protein